MTWVLVVAAAMLSVAGLLLVGRMTVGPTILDRSMALDVMMSVMVCDVALYAIWVEEPWTLPMLLVLASVGFVGAVSIARFASGEVDESLVDDGDDEPAEGEW